MIFLRSFRFRRAHATTLHSSSDSSLSSFQCIRTLFDGKWWTCCCINGRTHATVQLFIHQSILFLTKYNEKWNEYQQRICCFRWKMLIQFNHLLIYGNGFRHHRRPHPLLIAIVCTVCTVPLKLKPIFFRIYAAIACHTAAASRISCVR